MTTPEPPAANDRRDWLKPAHWRELIVRKPSVMLFGANLSAQVLTVALSPILTRLYLPEDFGVLGALSAIVLIGSPVMTGRYDVAMARAHTDREAYDLLRVCLRVMLITTLLAAVLFRLIPALAPDEWHLASMSEWWWAAPLGLAAVALYDALGIEASRRHTFGALARSKLTQAASGQLSQIAMGLMGWGTTGLILGYLINQLAGVGRLAKALWWQHPGRQAPPGGTSLATLAWMNRRFPMFSSGSALLDAAGKYIPQLAISVGWDPRIGGFVFLADRVVGRPLMMLSTSLLPVYIGRFNAALRDNPRGLFPLYREILFKQTAMTVAWSAAVLVLAPFVVAPLFGARWAEAVPYVQLAALVVAPIAALHAVAHTLELAGRNRVQFALVSTRVVLTLALLWICHREGVTALHTLASLAGLNLLMALLTAIVSAMVLRGMAALPGLGPAAE